MHTSLNVASHLARMASEHPTQVALHAPRGRVNVAGPTEHRAITFRELNADSDAIAHGLSSLGVARGTRAALMVPPSPDFFALTFALFKVGAVPVLIDPGMGVNNLGKCLAEAEPEAFIGVAKAHAARRMLGWAKRTVRVTVNVGRWRLFCDSSLARLRAAGRARGPYRIPDSQATEPAAVLFTSGSTGVAKGVVYVHGIFDAQVKLLKATYGIAPGEIDLCTFPLFALFGPALGMTCVIPDMNASRPARLDPRKAAAQIRQFGVTNMFGSPAVIRRLGELAEPIPPAPLPEGRGEKEPSGASTEPSTRSANSEFSPLPSGRGTGGVGSAFVTLRRVISAGAPASAASLERFVTLLPDGVEVFTPYGATEALPVANIGSREILSETRPLTDTGRGVCVGRPVAGVEVRIIRITDQPIAEWTDALLAAPDEVGEFVVRGPIVTRLYYNRPDATKLAKIRDPKTGEILHRMGDVGYLDAQGRLWFCGRKSHRVVTPNGTLFTDMVEPVFNTAGLAKRTALVGVQRAGRTYPVVCVEVEYDSDTALEITKSLLGDERRMILGPQACWDITLGELRAKSAEYFPAHRIVTFLEHHGPFPVDVRHNSKIFREKLAVWADKQLGSKWKPEEQA